MNQSTAYGWLMLSGICISLLFWRRVARRDSRLFYIYLGALGGAFLGAKVIYMAAEGWLRWHDTNRWLEWATGKTILGGLLGGYAGVEIAKKLVGYKDATGDWFAIIAPVGIVLGRIGCWTHGCCQGIRCSPTWFTIRDAKGIDRWPSVQAEILFNILALCVFLCMRRKRALLGQHFHIYLIAYGVFRFLHEFARQEPHLFGPISGYQIAAVAVAALGLWGFLKRKRELALAAKPEREISKLEAHVAPQERF
jgi:phosphatidylglycerol---prolipoprotein diacylglyceryl transferase